MPNWCRNRLTVTGAVSELTTFCQCAAGSGPRYLLSGDELEDALTAERVSDAWQRRVRGGSARAGQPANTRSAWAPVEPMSLLSLHALVPVPLAIRRRGYSFAGHDWQRTPWGVKWEADRVTRRRIAPERVQYDFRTPWDPPGAWLHAVAARRPSLTFRLEYHEEDWRQAGVLEAREGNVTVLEALRWSDHGRDAVRRAAEAWLAVRSFASQL
jgi:hypothetical protein